jgi:hypothetical protein
MKNPLDLFKREPVLVTKAIVGILSVILIANHSLSTELKIAIEGAVVSILAVLTRQTVTPNMKVETRTDGKPVEGIGAPPRE